MDDSRRKLPSWMLGVKKNENNNVSSNSNNNGSEKLVVQKKRKNDDEFERESSDVPMECDGGSRRIRRKGNGDSVNVEGDYECREGKKNDRGISHNVKGSLVGDEFGYEKRRNSARVRNEKVRSDVVDVDDYDYADGDNGIPGGKRKKGGRKQKGKGKSDVEERKKVEFEEDEVEDDDGGGAQVVMRKCKGKRLADRGKLVDSNDLVDVQRTLASISDDEDLTVEDLVSIAEEYVNKDMEAAPQLSPPQGISSVDNLMRIRKEHTVQSEEIGEKHTSETSIHDHSQLGGSPNSKLLNMEETGPHSLLNENVTVMKPIMSGDPTQDMLDLFLGHLLKKPQEEENKLDMSLAAQRQQPVDPPVDAVPYTKKKTSLKDKVAMFFD